MMARVINKDRPGMNPNRKQEKTMNPRILTSLLASAFAVASHAADAVITVDPDLPSYQRTDGVAGNLSSVGSDTLNNLMALWTEGFRRLYPNVNIQVEGKGSSTAPAALIGGAAQLGPMSRDMKKSEIEQIVEKYGYEPTGVSVALDALAVFVNKDNPIESISLAQIDSAFSKTNRRGGAPAETWGALGVEAADWKDRPISLYGRNAASGTYGFFKENALAKGDFRDTVKEQAGSASVVMGISEDRLGLGYSGVGYTTPGVRLLPVSDKDGAAFAPSYENVVSGKYPIWRPLYVYILKDPAQPLAPLTREFLRFVLSKEGQEIVVKDGFYPISAAQAAEIRKLLD